CCFGSLSGSRPGRGGSAFTIGSNACDNRVYLDSIALSNLDFLKNARGGRGDLGVNFVGRDLEKRFVALNLVTGLFQLLGNGSFEDRFAHLGHDYVSWHGVLPNWSISH